MAELKDGEVFEVWGSAKKPYKLKNIGGIYSCDCMSWKNQSTPTNLRSCKHLRARLGDAFEDARLGIISSQSTVEKVLLATKIEKSVPELLLAHSWDGVQDIKGWWYSEKLDGVRAYWNGKDFISRLGNTFFVPDFFKVGLPSTPLDGELWIGRKQFQRTSGLVRRQDMTDAWKEVRYLIFDAPSMKEPFEKRMNYISNIKTDYARGHEHYRCKDIKHLKEELDRIEKLGGEGLMLRQPGSLYEVGRSNTLLKVKSFVDDEAVVIGHEPGKGRHKGRLGSLRCTTTNGTEFSVGTGLSDAERNNPPKIGTKVTYRYQELTDDGVPRFPSFVGVPIDK